MPASICAGIFANMEPIQVGTPHRDYLTQRNIKGLDHTRYQVRKIWDWFQFQNYLYARLRGRHSYYYNFTVDDRLIASLLHPKVKLLHLMNGVSRGNTPWLTTFETIVPRYEFPARPQDVALLARPACKALLAVSNCTRRYQELWLMEKHPRLAQEILPKLQVLKVPQKRLLADPSQRERHPEWLQLSFVGGEFYRKGGYEVIRLAEEVLKRNWPVRFTVVGMLTPCHYPYNSTEAQTIEIQSIVARYPQQIQRIDRLPNPDVLALFRRTDIGLLPTWADSAPYGVLEMMASGCPVMGTDIRNLPEMIQPDRGWLLPLPQTPYADAELGDANRQRELSDELVQRMVTHVEWALNHRAEVDQMGATAWQWVDTEHNAETHLRRTEALYDSILGQ